MLHQLLRKVHPPRALQLCVCSSRDAVGRNMEAAQAQHHGWSTAAGPAMWQMLLSLSAVDVLLDCPLLQEWTAQEYTLAADNSSSLEYTV